MNRVLAHTGARYPIVQAPMGWIARTPLASAVSRAGGLGIIETSSGETENCKAEITQMGALGLPFGVNLPIRFLKDDAMLRFVCASGVGFVSTSAGSPAKFIALLKAAGITVYHAVPTVEAALKCVDAGIDALQGRVQRRHRVIDDDAGALQRGDELGRAASRGRHEADARLADEAQHRLVLQEADRQVHAEGQTAGQHGGDLALAVGRFAR